MIVLTSISESSSVRPTTCFLFHLSLADSNTRSNDWTDSSYMNFVCQSSRSCLLLTVVSAISENMPSRCVFSPSVSSQLTELGGNELSDLLSSLADLSHTGFSELIVDIRSSCLLCLRLAYRSTPEPIRVFYGGLDAIVMFLDRPDELSILDGDLSIGELTLTPRSMLLLSRLTQRSPSCQQSTRLGAYVCFLLFFRTVGC